MRRPCIMHQEYLTALSPQHSSLDLSQLLKPKTRGFERPKMRHQVACGTLGSYYAADVQTQRLRQHQDAGFGSENKDFENPVATYRWPHSMSRQTHTRRLWWIGPMKERTEKNCGSWFQSAHVKRYLNIRRDQGAKDIYRSRRKSYPGGQLVCKDWAKCDEQLRWQHQFSM